MIGLLFYMYEMRMNIPYYNAGFMDHSGVSIIIKKRYFYK